MIIGLTLAPESWIGCQQNLCGKRRLSIPTKKDILLHAVIIRCEVGIAVIMNILGSSMAIIMESCRGTQE